MATMNTAEVGVGAAKVTGAIWIAPKGTTLPTDATTALAGTYTLLGFTSDAGVTISENDSSQDLIAWEGRTKVYSVKTEYYETVAFTPIQTNADVFKLTYGSSNVTTSGTAITIKHKADTLDPVVIVIETSPRTGIVKRYCGTFQLTSRGDATLDGTQFDMRELTFSSIPDSNGVHMFEYASVTGATA